VVITDEVITSLILPPFLPNMFLKWLLILILNSIYWIRSSIRSFVQGFI